MATLDQAPSFKTFHFFKRRFKAKNRNLTYFIINNKGMLKSDLKNSISSTQANQLS